MSWDKPAVGQWAAPATKDEIRGYLSDRAAKPATAPVIVKAAPRPRMSAGFRSTEFWLAAVSCAAGLALCCVGLLRSSDVLALAGAALVGLSTVAYSHSRGKAKGRPYLPPVGRL